MSLGAGETSLINLTAAYTSFVNGGRKIKPSLIDRIQDRRGKNIYLDDLSVATIVENLILKIKLCRY